MSTAETCDRDCRQCGVAPIAERAHPNQPTTYDIPAVDGIKLMPITIPKGMTLLPQHSHPYDHITIIARGAVEVWADDEWLGRYEAPTTVTIKAGVKHKFLTLRTNTTLFCCHNISRNGEVQFNDDHHLVKEG